MIEMMITSPSRQETEYLCGCSREAAGRCGDERLQISKYVSCGELHRALDSEEGADLAYMDVTAQGVLEETERFRDKNKDAYLVLIAGLHMSPITYMRPGIRAEALILKPFDEAQAKAAVEEAFSELMKRRSSPDKSRMFVIDNQDGRVLVDYDSILFFESRSKKIYLCTGTKEYGFYGTMDQLQGELEQWFVRCHRGFLVNRKKIEKIAFARNIVVLADGSEIPVSRTFRAAMKRLGEGGEDERTEQDG